MILDTNFIIDLMNNEPKTLVKTEELLDNGESILVTSLSIFELFTGMSMSNKPEIEKNKINRIIENQTILNFDKDAAELSGELNGQLRKNGQAIESVDTMIAGIALLKKEKLMTRNIKHFSRIKNLEIESY